jgi:hypothetical protein
MARYFRENDRDAPKYVKEVIIQLYVLNEINVNLLVEQRYIMLQNVSWAYVSLN